jgi:hypothetical protein
MIKLSLAKFQLLLLSKALLRKRIFHFMSNGQELFLSIHYRIAHCTAL